MFWYGAHDRHFRVENDKEHELRFSDRSQSRSIQAAIERKALGRRRYKNLDGSRSRVYRPICPADCCSRSLCRSQDIQGYLCLRRKRLCQPMSIGGRLGPVWGQSMRLCAVCAPNEWESEPRVFREPTGLYQLVPRPAQSLPGCRIPERRLIRVLLNATREPAQQLGVSPDRVFRIPKWEPDGCLPEDCR